MSTQQQGWLTPQDIAETVGHTPRTIQRWCRERRIPHVRIGRLYRFTPQQLEEIEQAYGIEASTETVPAVKARNPAYRENITVVPMRRPA